MPVVTCTPGTPGCVWQLGDLITYSQLGWDGTPSTAAALLSANYNTVYASTFGVLEVGIPGSGGFSLLFTDASRVLDYLPQVGTPAALSTDLLNPTSSSSGIFGGEVVALKLNVDFSDAGVTTGASGLRFSDLTVCGLTMASNLNGSTVRQILAVANTLLGGGSTGVDITELDAILVALNASFFGGAPSTFAQDHLVNGACP